MSVTLEKFKLACKCVSSASDHVVLPPSLLPILESDIVKHDEGPLLLRITSTADNGDETTVFGSMLSFSAEENM